MFQLACPWNSKAQQTIVLILNTNGQKNIHKKVTRLNFHNILPPKNDRDKQMHDYEKQKEICEGESVEENQKKILYVVIFDSHRKIQINKMHEIFY